jgi:hypothetical protein
MSHIEVNRTSLENVDIDLFKLTLDLVAEECHGSSSDTIKDFYGHDVHQSEGETLVGAVKTTDVERGIGAIIKDGKLQFIGDKWGYERAYSQLQKSIENTYTKLAIVKAFKSMGYDTVLQSLDDGSILIRGVSE